MSMVCMYYFRLGTRVRGLVNGLGDFPILTRNFEIAPVMSMLFRLPKFEMSLCVCQLAYFDVVFQFSISVFIRDRISIHYVYCVI